MEKQILLYLEMMICVSTEVLRRSMELYSIQLLGVNSFLEVLEKSD